MSCCGREHDMTAIRHSIQPEGLGVGMGGQYRVREQFAKSRLASRREGPRIVHDLLIGEHGQRRVQVVEVFIYQRQADHWPLEELLGFTVRIPVSPKSRPGEDPGYDRNEVTFAFIDTLCLLDVEFPRAEPVEVRLRFC